MSAPAFPNRRVVGRARRGAGPLALAALALIALAAPAGADPEYGALVLTGLDPVLRATDDPRLLGTSRLAVREWLLARGVDPLRDPPTPDFASVMTAAFAREIKVDLERRDTTVEIDGATGLVSVFKYPRWFVLFPPSEPLPGGFVWNPPRAIDDPDLDIFIDDLTAAARRRFEVGAQATRAELLDIRSGRGGRGDREGLLNLTIPIKLPRTLEKIIGRGEKTNIKVSGREHISISGESTTTNKFVPNERRQSQSLFPTLDMEQQLQINLAGTIGEKIQIEVDHNSEVIGPDATKIKLAYRGDEDEVIQSIETGDVGLTLPGSQLLGYSSNKSGLFGVKVAGAFGRADFTVVASKQKAESAAKSFNSRGGEPTEHVIECQNYLKFRFFRLDLPAREVFGPYAADDPGRAVGESIDPSSVQIYQFLGSGTPGPDEVQDVALYLDATGRWDPGVIFAQPPAETGLRWRRITDFELLLDQNGNLVAIDLKREYSTSDILGVIYDVVGDIRNPGTTLVYEVGDDPGLDEANRVVINGTAYLRMKLLKPTIYSAQNSHSWGYPLKNIYPLGGTNIDAESFDLRIEFTGQGPDIPSQDVSALQWIRIFGLDRTDPQRTGPPDGYVDKEDQYLFDLQKGLLKFPLDFPEPFNAQRAKYEGYAATDTFAWDASLLSQNLVPQIYDYELLNQLGQYNRFRLVARHAAASGTIDLRDSNIEEGSETVILDGQTLQRGTDYDIDYVFGQVTLKGDAAARLSTDSQISVNYQYAPFMGGGNSSLLGFNLGFDLGRESRVATTWLFESNQIAGYKAKLGEEPSRTLVGNLNAQHTFKPYFLTHVANFLARRDTDRESSVQLNGEIAVSVPNPNTKGDVFLEDFEGIDASDVMPVSRLAWQWGSAPVAGRDPTYVAATGDDRDFVPAFRAETRWFLPKDNVLRRYLNPDLREEEGREPQQVLQVWIDAGGSGWQEASWGGLMRGLGRSGLDLTKAQFLEFWVNDFRPEPDDRRGALHFDFGYLSEDFYWPDDGTGAAEVGTFQFEDRNRDGVFTNDEDTGLDGVAQGTASADYYNAEFISYDNPFPRINGTEGNVREDTEDLDGDTLFDERNGYYTITVDLADSALVDVLRDYPADRTTGIPAGQAWRKFRIRLNDALSVSPAGGTAPRIDQVTHIRVWYEDRSGGAPAQTVLQLSDLKFLGSRWERDGIRKRLTEDLLTPAERGPAEAFFIGEVNNKENPDYYSPFNVRVERDIEEKESSLVLDFTELERDHLARVSKYVSPRGDDYTQYGTINWWWFCPRPDLSDLDLFFRVGGDTLNYYEVRYRFEEGPGPRTGWRQVNLDLAELTNAKFASPDSAYGWIATTVADIANGHSYRVRVVGKPDLRRVKRYYFGVENDGRDEPVSGYFYLNEVRLEDVKRESGMAQRVAARLNMADVLKVDFDWSRRDAEFHGLNASRGQGFTNEDWSLSGSLRLDDYVPLLGFQMPVNLSRRQAIQRPKYLTNSDVELIDEAIKNAQSTVDTRESFSVRLSHAPSRGALPRYLIDPWTFSLSGARSSARGPLERQRQRNLQGAVGYDLSIASAHNYKLGRVPLLDAVPVLGNIGLVPKKISFGGSFSRGERESETVLTTGDVVPRPTQTTRRGSLNGALEYDPLPLARVSLRVRSERDMLRRREVLGLNVGEELSYGQDLQVQFNPPKGTELPRSAVFSPLRAALAALNSMRPSVTFSGKYEVNKDPSIRQPGDPPDIRSIGNGGDWDFRFSLPIDRFIRERFPERGAGGDRERQQAIDRQRRMGRRGSRGAPSPAPEAARPEEPPAPPTGRGEETPPEQAEPTPPAPPEQPEAPPAGDEEEALTPEERRRREEEALLEQAREQEELERAEREREGAAPADTAAAGGRLRLPNPGKFLLNMLRNTSPIQTSYSLSRTSSYARLRGEDDFWYRVGLGGALDIADSLYATSRLTDRARLQLSTSLKLSRTVSADVKFAESTGRTEQAGLNQKQYQQDWPDLRLAVTGLERLSIFGGGGTEGWFRNSSLDIGYKHSKTVAGATATQYNPRTSTTISPRWSMTFQNQMSASLNVGISSDRTLSNGTETRSSRLNVGVQVRHSFRAERLLAKLKLYKPGAIPTINMDVDLSYGRDRDERRLPGAEAPDAQTGQDRISFNPRFSYQVTKNLTGALRFIYSRNRAIQTDTVTQTFGLGLEATFVF